MPKKIIDRTLNLFPSKLVKSSNKSPKSEKDILSSYIGRLYIEIKALRCEVRELKQMLRK